MALLIEKENKYGSTTSYFKIVDLNINWLDKQSHISLCGWTDAQARLDGNQPTMQFSYDYAGEEFPFIDEEPQNEREIAYTKIKETDEFINAADA